MVGDKESTKKSIVREIEHEARGNREHLPGRTAICTLEAVVRLKPAQQRDTQRDNIFIFDASFFTRGRRIEGNSCRARQGGTVDIGEVLGSDKKNERRNAVTMSSPKEKTEVPSFLSISHWVQSTAL